MIKLPPPPSVDVTYPATTDYFWGTIEQNATAQPAAGTFSTGSGPFGFKTSLVLPGDSVRPLHSVFVQWMSFLVLVVLVGILGARRAQRQAVPLFLHYETQLTLGTFNNLRKLTQL